MIFFWEKGANAFSILKWRRQGESSLNTGLLNDVPPEIELSEYGRVPSPGSESPSGLLHGESSDQIADLDLFFERLYNYYCEKGLWCIITKWIVELLTLAFIICFSGFFLLLVDWNGLRNAKCGMDAVESGIKLCNLAKESIHDHPLTPLTLSRAILIAYLMITSIYWIFSVLSFFAQLEDTLHIRHFYYNSSQQICVVKDLSAHDMVMRLMRKENYLIGLLNKGVLAFPISHWVPGAGPVVTSYTNGNQYCLMLTNTLEWTINWCILQSMFDRNSCVRRGFVSDPKALKKRLRVVGLVMLVLSPFLVIFMLVYHFLRHAEEFYNHPSTASSRRWSNLAKWIFREVNEVNHLFKHRISGSIPHASDYIKQFPSPIISIIAKFISFVSGGFAAVLIIIAFLDESLLEGHIFGRNLLWYAAVFGTITAISRAAIPDELLVLDPKGAMSKVVQHTHYMPKRWRCKENKEIVHMEFETLFQYRGIMLLEEVASIFLTPYLLIFVVPKRVDDILQFISDFTINVEGVGHVCSFSAFYFQDHGNSSYGSPYNAPSARRSSQGKMEKSLLSFQSSYPSWEPNSQGKQFLSNLKSFKEQKLQQQGTRQSYSPKMWPRNPVLRSHGDRISIFPWEMPHNNSRTGYQLDSKWLIDEDHKNHPYLPDWYYTCHPSIESGHTGGVPVAEQHLQGYQIPSSVTHDESREEDYEGHVYKHSSRSHLEASTSAHFFHESVFQRHEPNNWAQSTGSRWWDRSGPLDAQPESSFLEPPNFNHYTADVRSRSFSRSCIEQEASSDPCGTHSERSFLQPGDWNHNILDVHDDDFKERILIEQGVRSGHPESSFIEPLDFNHYTYDIHNDNFSERSSEQEQPIYWRNSNDLSRTVYMDEMETGDDIILHFDDIHSRPLEAPMAKLEPPKL